MSVVAQQVVCIGDADVGQGVGWIEVRRFLKAREPPLEALLGPVAPKIAALEIGLEGSGVHRSGYAKPGFLLWSHVHLDLRDDRLRNLALQREDVAQVALVGLG